MKLIPILIDEMDINNFNGGSVSGGIWSGYQPGAGTNTYIYNSTWLYEQKKNYVIEVKFNTSNTNYFSTLNLGIFIIHWHRDTADYVGVLDGGSYKTFTADTKGDKTYKLILKTDKSYEIYINDVLFQSGNVTNLPADGDKSISCSINYGYARIDYIRIYEIKNDKYLFQDGTEIKTYASIEYSMLFDGIDDGIIANTPLITSASNTFTYEFWALPQATHEIDSESTSGISGTSGQKWAIGAGHGGSNAGAGVSVGTNGISVYEHGVSYLPALLVYPTTINDWVHIAVVYENKQPTLYINGVFAKTGLTSTRSAVYPSAEFGTGAYGKFKGKLKDIRIWNYARTQAEIQADMNKTLTGTETGLIGYWKMNEGQGTIINDSSPSGNHATASGNPTWVTEKFGWITVGSFPATRSMFDQHGMTDLSIIDNNAIQQLTSDTPELLCWTDEEGDSVVRQTNITAVPLPQLLLPVGDIEVGEIESVKIIAAAISAYTDNIIPAMTNYTTPSGIVTASEEKQYYPAWRAFNRRSGDWETGNAISTKWIAYDFGIPKLIGKFTITPTYSTYAPNNLTFEGWDGSQWVALCQFTNITGWTNGVKKEFTFTPSEAYSKYRIRMDQVGVITIDEIEMMEVISGNTDTKILVSGDSGANWKGKNGVVDISDLTQVKANGFTPDEFNALTKQELASLFPNGTARFAFYLEQEKSTDIVQIDSLSINEKVYTMTPSIESLKVIYSLLEAEKPKIYVSRDDGVTWKEVQSDTLTSLEELPEGNKLRVKVVLSNGQELHALSYSWI